MRYRTTSILLVLFFAGLGALWYADYARVPSRLERQVMANRLLPELIDVPPRDFLRLEIGHGTGGETIAIERVADGRWQMLKPIDTAADSETVETLLRNLKDLAKSLDSGTIDGDAATYGLDKPRATLKVYVKDKEEPLVLDIGESRKSRVYVRPGADSGIEVVDGRLLSAVDLKPAEWRDKLVFHVPSFRVEGVTLDESDPKRSIKVKRLERHWNILRPFEAVADDDKVEGLVAELSALRVVDESQDFVENDVKDLAKYGLDSPSWKITLEPFAKSGSPQVVLLGNAVPGKPDHRYAMRGDQNDVMSLDVKRLRDAVPSARALRSQKVLDFTPARVTRIQIDAPEMVFDLSRGPTGWELKSPVPGTADPIAAQSLLTKLADLKASEFLDVSEVLEPRVDSPTFRVRVWQSAPASPGAAPADLSASVGGLLKVDLSLGRVDALKKTVYGRVQGDPTVMAFPDEILKEMPRGVFAFRDRSVLSLKPEQFASVTVERPGSRVTIIPNGLSGKGLKSRMKEPIDAPTDEASVTSLILALANLRAVSWESDSIADPRIYGFDSPFIRVRWTLQKNPEPAASKRVKPASPTEGVLRIGRLKSRDGSFFANIEGDSRVFVVDGKVVAALEAELHDKSVFTFRPETAEKISLEWPSRSLALVAAPRLTSATSWNVEAGYDASRFDFSALNRLVNFMSDLKTSRYFQYDGPIDDVAGLNPARVTVKMSIAGDPRELVLRVGNTRPDGSCFATTSAGPSGPLFMLIADESIKALFRAPGRSNDLPDDPFAPIQVPPPATASR